MRKALMLVLGLFVLCTQLLAQNRTVIGTVTDEKGGGVPNASVTVKGSKIGTTTGSNGTFTLNVPADAKTLVITSVGFEKQEIGIGNQNSVRIALRSADQTLDEVVVTVPYGTVKKTSFTGSENTISAKTLQKQQVTSVTRALEGQVPGIIATNGGGGPGTGASIMIRGVGSVNATSTPLYVVNGIPYDGSIASLSTDEIESVTVLKDAAAASLYGSRAANGVIMITTRKGRAGRATVNAKVVQGFMTRAIPEYDRVGAKDYYELTWEAYRNALAYTATNPISMAAAGVKASNELTDANHLAYNAYNVPGNQLVDPVTGKLNPNAKLLYNDSWEDALYRTAQRKNVNVNISGANDKTDYFISAGYLNEEGVLKFSGYKRYNTRVNLNTQATNWLKSGLNLDGAIANQSNVPSGGTTTTNPFYYTRQMGPIYPVYVYDASGAVKMDPVTGQKMLDWGKSLPGQYGTRPYAPNSNLLGSLDLDDRLADIFNGNANTYLEASFLKSFTFKTTFGANFWNSTGTTFQNGQFGDADNVKGRSTKQNERQVSYTLNQVLNWNKTFGEHTVRALAGHENYKYIYDFQSATRTNFPFPGTNELSTAATLEGATSYQHNHRIEGYFSKVDYEYAGKYLASASYRKDGTSRFYEDKRWGDFYSASLGWRLSKESFLQNVKWLNDLKLRASYGEQGNESIGTYYAYQSLYNLGWNNANNPGATAGGLPNQNLVWEANKTLNVGVDFAVLKNRVSGTVEFFNRVSDNLLFDVPLPYSTGYQSITQNVGSMFNRGVELQLGYNAIRQKDFDWRIDLNLTHFKNEITKLPPGKPSEDGIISGTKKLLAGHGIYDFYIREYAGVDPSTGEALFYKDVLDASGKATGERVLTNNSSQASLYYHGSALPKVSGGLTNSFRYKNFDLSFLLTFAYGGKFYDQNYQSIMHFGSYGTAWSSDILKRWQKPGDITNVPRLYVNAANQNPISTRFLFDASYLNVKNITLSYTMPSDLTSRIRLQGVQIFANVDNAYLFTTKKGMDPQRAFNGTSDWSYTPYRTMSVGLNVNL